MAYMSDAYVKQKQWWMGNPPERLANCVTTEECAKAVRMSQSTVLKWVTTKRLPARRGPDKRTWFIRIRDWEAFLAMNPKLAMKARSDAGV